MIYLSHKSLISNITKPLNSLRYYSSSTSIDSIRNTFLSYFEKNGHLKVDSSSLIPHTDNTLLFTNSGMVQFKNCFTGIEKPLRPLCTSVQRCVRAGGKHNDLENVGYTARHHTFFEMLGNFSFGGYEHFKRDAIKHAWRLLTVDFGLLVERLSVTVLHGDEESFKIWRDDIGLPSEKILFKGEADNFWSMGDGPGPCGPCSEIFWDQGKEIDGDRYLEIWNLVFMQYQRDEVGNLTPLKTPCVDTGMGLERMATVLQGVHSNYDIDLFVRLLSAVRTHALQTTPSIANMLDDSKIQTAMRVVADHLRATSFLIADGVIPFYTGRGYVLRKIIRRALSYGMTLGFQGPFLSQLFPYLAKEMGDIYPLLLQRAPEIINVIYNEELTFYSAIERGVPHLNDLIESKQLNEKSVFDIFNTYGLPLEISEVKAKQANIDLSMEKIQMYIDEMKEKSKSTWKKDKNSVPEPVLKWKNDSVEPEFIGYKTTKATTTVLKSYFNPDQDNIAYISLEQSPFYGNSGGQIGDIGTVIGKSGNQYRAVDCMKPYENGLVILLEIDPKIHLFTDLSTDLKEGSIVEAKVDNKTRQQTAIHHTATHLLQAALRSVLKSKSSSVVQAGSYVGPDALRFDFTHPAKMTKSEIQQVEDFINNIIALDSDVETVETPYAEACKSDAIQLFSEKYRDVVRVVDVPGFSKELCGGTHVKRTSELQYFKIISESSVAAGTRRIEALAGPIAIKWLASNSDILGNISRKLEVQTPAIEKQIDQLLLTCKDMDRQISDLKQRLLLNSIKSTSGTVDGQNIIIHLIDSDISIEKKGLQDIGNSLSKHKPDSVHVVMTLDGKLLVTLGSNSLDTSADKIIKQLFIVIGSGKGGGSKQMAQASIGGGIDKSAIENVYKWANIQNK